MADSYSIYRTGGGDRQAVGLIADRGGHSTSAPPEDLFAEKKAEKDANVSRPAQAAYLDGSKFAGRRSSRQFCGLPLATACRIASDARPAGRPPAPDGTPPCPTNRRTRRSGDQSPPAPESGFGNTAANDPVPGRALRCNGPRAGYLLTRCPPSHAGKPALSGRGPAMLVSIAPQRLA